MTRKLSIHINEEDQAILQDLMDYWDTRNISGIIKKTLYIAHQTLDLLDNRKIDQSDLIKAIRKKTGLKKNDAINLALKTYLQT